MPDKTKTEKPVKYPFLICTALETPKVRKS